MKRHRKMNRMQKRRRSGTGQNETINQSRRRGGGDVRAFGIDRRDTHVLTAGDGKRDRELRSSLVGCCYLVQEGAYTYGMSKVNLKRMEKCGGRC